MCFNKIGDISTQNVSSLKLVDKFTYQGSSISSTETDIDTWLAKAWTAISRLLVIWKSDLTDKMKHSFFQTAVISILLYGCTTWNPSQGWAKAERPARTYIQQLCKDTGCSTEDLPKAINDWEGWRERVRDICAVGTTRWWWYLFNPTDSYFYLESEHKISCSLLLGITHFSPHNELIHLPYIPGQTRRWRAASYWNSIRALETGDRTRSPYLLP